MVVARCLLALVSIAVAVTGQRCQWYGGGSCCPELTPENRRLTQTTDYVLFVPRTEESRRLDNICYTKFPVPDSPNTYILYASRVYVDGHNRVDTYVITEVEPGTDRLANAQCSFTDTFFGRVERPNYVNGCNLYVVYRCVTSGECRTDDFYLRDLPLPVFGLSPIRQRIGQACLAEVNSVISNNGLPSPDFQILPMRLPSQCVTRQVCTLRPARQQLQQIIQYPTILA